MRAKEHVANVCGKWPPTVQFGEVRVVHVIHLPVPVGCHLNQEAFRGVWTPPTSKRLGAGKSFGLLRGKSQDARTKMLKGP